MSTEEIQIPIQGAYLQGILTLPANAKGLVLFAHGSGSSRLSRRNQFVASVLSDASLATLLFDLLTPEEGVVDDETAELRFNIPLLANRLDAAATWCSKQHALESLPISYFGASTGGGAALMAAAKHPKIVKAIVSRGGRPDLALDDLPQVRAPTLLIVGGNDDVVIGMNKTALAGLACIKKLEIVPGATHLFEEPGTLNVVADLARDWFEKYLVECYQGV